MRRPKVKLDNLIAFMTVAARHNIDDAADELGLSASGVRKQLESIENAFGIRLFESIRGSLVLTEEGELFYEDARKAVDQVLLAEEQVYARQAIRSHHLLVGHSTNLPSKLIALIAQIKLEDTHPVQIEHRSGLTSTTVRRVIEGMQGLGFCQSAHPNCSFEPSMRSRWLPVYLRATGWQQGLRSLRTTSMANRSLPFPESPGRNVIKK